jgi:hypothetical protein
MQVFQVGAARFLRFSHMFIVAFILVGPFLPWAAALHIHAVFVPIVVLQWALNQNRCVLTQLEHRLRRSPAPEAEIKKEDEDAFVKSLLKICFKNLPSDFAIRIGVWTITWSCWMVTVLRLWSAHGRT